MKCQVTYEVYRASKDASLPEICPECYQTMERIYTVPQAIIKASDYYHMGVGKQITNSSQVKDELKRYKDIHGSELIELGNEKPIVKTQESRYDFTEQETRGIYQTLEAAGVPE
jgi:predicted nucleic acid-binding Zn ribbon protein